MAKFTFTEDIETSVGKPIDFSFKKIKKLEDKRERVHLKAIVDFHINETTITDCGHPIDFSCMKLSKATALGPENARFSRIGKLPEKSLTSRKYLSKSLWLNNNKLTSIENIEELVQSVVDAPEKLGWLDLSFNHISTIDNCILKFENLRILYLHGNSIMNLDEIYKLRNLIKLKTLTLHGNPISDVPKYRSYIIAMLPQIKNLDFTPVLNSERQRPAPPEALKKINEWNQHKI